MGRGVANRGAQPALIAGALVLLMGASLALRIGTLDAGYWIDEGIAVGIASHDFADIPRVLAQDGNPPLYYLLLHGWMQIFGTTEAATRALSLLFALLAIPASFWAGAAVFDRRAGALAAAGAAGSPFLTYYAQETRMYSLVVLLSILASASFVLVFVRGDRRHLPLLGLWLALLLYTHTWGLFLAAAMALAWLTLWRRGDVEARDGARLGVVLALLYAPWLPSVISQAANTAAPWAERPSPLLLLGIPGGLFGHFAVPLLALAVFFALRRRPPLDKAVRVLAGIAVATAGLAWLCSQIQPAWATRYLAVLLGPTAARAGVRRLARRALDRAGALRRRGRVADDRPAADQEQRADRVREHRAVRSAPATSSWRRSPSRCRRCTATCPRASSTSRRWASSPTRARPTGARASSACAPARPRRELLPVLARREHGRRILIVTPVAGSKLSQAPWSRSVRIRTREWRAALANSPYVRRIGGISTLPVAQEHRPRGALRSPSSECGRAGGRRGRSAARPPSSGPSGAGAGRRTPPPRPRPRSGRRGPGPVRDRPVTA